MSKRRCAAIALADQYLLAAEGYAKAVDVAGLHAAFHERGGIAIMHTFIHCARPECTCAKKRTSKVVKTQLTRMTVRKFMQSCTPNTPNRVHVCAKRVHVCRKRSRLRAPARPRRWKQVVAAPLRPVSLRASTPRGQDPVRRPQSSGEEPTFCSRPRTEVRHLPTVFRTEQKKKNSSFAGEEIVHVTRWAPY